MAYRCPKRRDFMPEVHKEPDFKIRALQTINAHIHSDGKVIESTVGILVWDDYSHMMCLNCGYIATVGDFTTGKALSWPSVRRALRKLTAWP